MNSIILEARGLTKEYKQTIALDHINLQIKKGKIYGFIGQNGAGKTTFLRLVTGLAFPTSGTLALWGKSSKEELQKQRKRIGCMIETPALFPAMTAYQNMEVQRIQRGICCHAGLSKSTLLRAFTKSKGVTPYCYLENIRIGAAKKLLEQGVAPIEADLQTGFSDQSHFTNYFNRFIGLAPGVYREIFLKGDGTGGEQHGE